MRVIAGMAGHALRGEGPAGVPGGGHAAAAKSLKHFSKAVRSDLKVN